MRRTRNLAIVIACVMLPVGTFTFLYRNDFLVTYHRQRLASEISAWRAAPAAGESKDYRNYSGIESELSKLVALGALDRIELRIRLYTDGVISPLPSLNRISTGQNPAPVFHHVKGDPRNQPQTVVIWCAPGDTTFWRRFAESTLEANERGGGERTDARESPN